MLVLDTAGFTLNMVVLYLNVVIRSDPRVLGTVMFASKIVLSLGAV